MKLLWSRFSESFDNKTAYAPGSQATAVLPVVVWIAVMLVLRLVPQINVPDDIRDISAAVLFAILAGIASLVSWRVGIGRRNLFSFLQLLESGFYIGAFVSASAFSDAPASYVLAGFYIAACVHWGVRLPFTVIGLLPHIIVPCAVIATIGLDPIVASMLMIGVLLFISAGNISAHHHRHSIYTARAEDVLNRIESAFNSCREGVAADLETQIGALAHRLRNNLYFSADYIDELRDTTQPGSKEDELISSSLDSIRQTVTLLEDFLKGFGKRTENPSFRLPHLASSVEVNGHDGWGDILEWKKLPDVRVSGHESMVALSIRSLVDNAVEAGARSVSISGALVAEDRLVLKIADDGPGLPARVRKNLFKPYNTYAKSHGVGLGIYFAAHIIRDAGGSIELSETGLSGTCFHVILLLADSQDGECRESSAEIVDPKAAVV
ncbi:MAG: HAMP domain-containing histidine kinase [Deltaproteobacteria bacterium]|nr:HAMP domain-containing histidine kinase [Deltaproteobacteria bacterium]